MVKGLQCIYTHEFNGETLATCQQVNHLSMIFSCKALAAKRNNTHGPSTQCIMCR